MLAYRAAGDTVTGAAPARRSVKVLVALCFAALVCDGYDLVVYGATVPSLLDYEPWSLTANQVGVIGSYTLMGMLVGAVSSGALAARFGARRVYLGSLFWFATVMGACALAPTPEVFGLLRFLGGLGLGGFVPVSVALIMEYSPATRRQFNNALAACGYCVGGILSALLGIALLPEVSFRWMYAVSLVVLITVFPLAWKLLPELPSYLVAQGRIEEATARVREFGLDPAILTPGPERSSASLRELLRPQRLPAVALLTLASFCGLLMSYGTNSWLPHIMKNAGYSLGSSLVFLLVLNAGAMGGVAITSSPADRFGPKRVTTASFLLAAGSIALLSVRMPPGALYVMVALAGAGALGTQILIMGYVGAAFEGTLRAPAVGVVVGLGRVGAVLGPLEGGWIAGSALGYQWNFYAFATVAVLGTVAAALVPLARGAAASGGEPRTETVVPVHG
ncbi:MFS transporter [Nocardia neocaledoniensis NBRC 108232]|uniref:AAHS family benzoate transporter-like MFS transporter n=1 Tax=Nocardia neocaledoniensis TaxID=236511 RepID=A0A317N617_9NOCA|nr:MFS transporter [Nocardia neocaledoniensis]PWV67578.1 AAHS family benzoate transporter-like MFS transporter [Nocardia neocaledoniensis]GEM31276.1 MFS transporter [Nocardia neocaledoniensis NBRC 108232]